MTGFLRLEHIQCILDRDKENDIVIEAEIMRASAQPGAGHWQGDCTRYRRSSPLTQKFVIFIHLFHSIFALLFICFIKNLLLIFIHLR